MKKTYEHQHRKRIKNIKSAKHSDIKIGTVLSFGYSKSKSNKRPIVLVLNPSDDNGLMHCLVLDYMDLKHTDILRDYILNEYKEVTKQKGLNVQLSLYKISSDNPKVFYNFKLKIFLAKYLKEAIYRTYDNKYIKNIKLLDYRF